MRRGAPEMRLRKRSLLDYYYFDFISVMLPIVDFPSAVKEFVDFFSKNFSYHELRRIKAENEKLRPIVEKMLARMET